MTATITEQTDLRPLAEDALAELYLTGDDDAQAAVLAELARRDRSDRARAKRQAVESEWYDAAFAQYLGADAECRGNLLSRFGEMEGITDAMILWRGGEAWARRRASEELCEFWDAHAGRLSIARYRRELDMARRQDRDERDLANGAGIPAPEPEQTWERVTGGAVRPVSVPVGSLTVDAWAAMAASGTITLHPSRVAAETALTPSPVAPLPPPTPGTIARYITALAAMTNHVDSMTAARNRIG